MNQNAKIGFFPHADTGCYWYRIKTPMDALKRAGFDVKRIDWEKPVEKFEDYVSFQMYGIQGISVAQIAEFIKEQKKKFVFDIDDDITAIQPDNIHYYSVKADAYTAFELMEMADEVTVTTENLKKALSKCTKAPITVVPNCYVPEEWGQRKRKGGKLRVGFSGGMSHISDLILILPTIAALQKKHDFDFIIYGIGSKEPYENWFKRIQSRATPELIEQMKLFDRLLNDISFEWVPFVNWREHPQVLANIDLDIGLCPLLDTEFNRGKSPIKAMEYGLVGTLSVASNLPPFTEEPTSILVDNDKWESALEYVLTLTDEQREELVSKNREWIQDNRDINKNLDILKKVYVQQ